MKQFDAKITFGSEDELPITTMSSGTTAVNKTGAWKYLEPYYQDLTPPCVQRCLVGNDIVNLMRLVHDGNFDEAARYLLEFNPLPSSLGRVCPHPCEQPCNRKAMGGAVQIQSVERFLGDYALENHIVPPIPPTTGVSVAVVGAGPAGLTAAYFLRLNGHSVTVYEKSDRIGGLLWSGIPPYRMPRNILQDELQRFYDIGIDFRLNHALGQEVTLDNLRKAYSAVVIAVGLPRSRSLGIPGEDLPGVLDGVKFLEQVHRGNPPNIGENVVVVGGGNTALDCARTALRLGRKVNILYRRSQMEMPAFKDEIKEALEEGLNIRYLTQPVRVLEENGQISGLECIRMELGDKDASGRRRPVPIAGSEFVIAADTVIKALGETFDPSILGSKEEIREVNRFLETRWSNVFACGDCVTEAGTVGAAVRLGRQTAQKVHELFSSEPFRGQEPLQVRNASPDIAKFKSFNTSYFQVATPKARSVRDPSERSKDFEEIIGALTKEEILYEAQRCFKCGTCNLCGNCELFCPDAAIQLNPSGDGYMILYEYCKGCGVCVEECPRGAIHLRRVQSEWA